MSEKISPIELNDALWVIGSEMCVRKDKAYCAMNCPLECDKMHKMGKQASYIDTGTDVRKRNKTLFEK